MADVSPKPATIGTSVRSTSRETGSLKMTSENSTVKNGAEDFEDHRIELFRCLAGLVVMSRGGIRSHVGVIIKLLDEFWHTHLGACLDVLRALEEVLSVVSD